MTTTSAKVLSTALIAITILFLGSYYGFGISHLKGQSVEGGFNSSESIYVPCGDAVAPSCNGRCQPQENKIGRCEATGSLLQFCKCNYND